MTMSKNFLSEIIDNKLEEIRERRNINPEHVLISRLDRVRPPRSLYKALRTVNTVGVIAEVKRRSPSKGDLNTTLDPVWMARVYQNARASAISVLTDEKYFGGSLDDLQSVSSQVGIPVLRKDFILDEYQVVESRANGADAILLIVRALTGDKLACLINAASELGMDALVEVHDEEDVDLALASGARLIGINNRDLESFHTTIEVTQRLAPYIRDRTDSEVLVISESGIFSRSDVESVQAAGADAVLVGEALVVSGDPAKKIEELRGERRG
ncbi:Indole-3-glycerol-phosphate synthase [Thermobaculum terrenum ATCC BAA-798]|uniref:Indole-3-glycerol phosphate synthase n=2 Tax=Thermobaculum TaxID=262406 RepID=D1CBJ4_THET1|nr:Indole-3-glycerol-phosphate synthase [Thermobaculum terrenum ATCC BAA-798]